MKDKLEEKLNEPRSIKGKVEVTADHIISRLRKIVQPPGKKGTWLRKLNDKQLAEVYHRMRLKQTVYHIASVAQREWKIQPKSSIKSLCRALTAFRKEALGLLEDHEQSFPRSEEKTRFVEEEEKRAKAILKKVDGMEELSWLIRTQRERLEALISKEKTFPFKFTDKTVEILGKLIDTYLNYQVELGLLKAVPREVDIYLKREWDGILESFIQDDGTRMEEASKRLIDMAKGKALVLKKEEDGSYSLEREQESGTKEV